MISRKLAETLYRLGNDKGDGYAPYQDDAEDETIEAAIKAAEEDGWKLILERENDRTVALLENEDLELLAIGGDAMGDGAWAVCITDVAGVVLTPAGLARWAHEAREHDDLNLTKTIGIIKDGTGKAKVRAMSEMRDLWCEASAARLAAKAEEGE